MEATQYIFWQEEDAFLGYLVDHPDHWTQGTTLDELEEHLRDLHTDLSTAELSSRDSN